MAGAGWAGLLISGGSTAECGAAETSASVRSGDGAGDHGDQGHEHRCHEAMVRDGLQQPPARPAR